MASFSNYSLFFFVLISVISLSHQLSQRCGNSCRDDSNCQNGAYELCGCQKCYKGKGESCGIAGVCRTGYRCKYTPASFSGVCEPGDNLILDGVHPKVGPPNSKTIFQRFKNIFGF